MVANSIPQTITHWRIDPAHSQVEFAARHMMFTTVKGRFTEVEGTLTLDEANPANSSVEVTIQAASISTSDDKRDGHLRSADFLDVENFPTLTFRSTRVEAKDDENLRLIGDLTIRGVTHEVTLDTVYNGRGVNPWGQAVAGFTAETTINRIDYGLTWNVALEAGGVLVSEKIKISIEVQAVEAA